MKIRVTTRFLYMSEDNTREKALEIGEYTVPRQVEQWVADLALGMGFATIVPTRRSSKKAPENKSKKVSESK